MRLDHEQEQGRFRRSQVAGYMARWRRTRAKERWYPHGHREFRLRRLGGGGGGGNTIRGQRPVLEPPGRL